MMLAVPAEKSERSIRLYIIFAVRHRLDIIAAGFLEFSGCMHDPPQGPVRLRQIRYREQRLFRPIPGGHLEIALWPDRLSLSLELETSDAMREGEMSITAGAKRTSVSLARSRRATLEVFGGDPEPPRALIEADPALTTSFDPALGCQIVRLPENPWSNAKGTYYPEEHLDRLDRWRLTLRNDADREAVARLMFVQEHHLPITGFTPMLCDPDGTPSGLPVQISKNWHQRPQRLQ